MPQDEIVIDILDDGSLTIVTDAISVGNHRNADELLETLQRLMGTTADIKPKGHHEKQTHQPHRTA